MTNIQLTWRWIRRHTSWLFGIALVLILVGNLLFRPLARPSMAASPLTHSIGILGSSLILLAPIYSVRKRTRLIKAGRMRTWLSWHTFLALVGCVLVEVHAGPFFYGIGGLARVTMWLVVLSGISGRYICEGSFLRAFCLSAHSWLCWSLVCCGLFLRGGCPDRLAWPIPPPKASAPCVTSRGGASTSRAA